MIQSLCIIFPTLFTPPLFYHTGKQTSLTLPLISHLPYLCLTAHAGTKMNLYEVHLNLSQITRRTQNTHAFLQLCPPMSVFCATNPPTFDTCHVNCDGARLTALLKIEGMGIFGNRNFNGYWKEKRVKCTLLQAKIVFVRVLTSAHIKPY